MKKMNLFLSTLTLCGLVSFAGCNNTNSNTSSSTSSVSSSIVAAETVTYKFTVKSISGDRVGDATIEIYKDGKYKCLVHEKGVYAFKRYDDKHSAVTVVNDGNQIYTMKLDGEYTSLLTGAVYRDSTDILPMTCDILISDVK